MRSNEAILMVRSVAKRRVSNHRIAVTPYVSTCAGTTRGGVMGVKLEAQDIRLEYHQPRTNSRLLALDGVNLKIMDGEFVSIVGPSGCGKTTFLSVVDGLIAASGGR